MGSLDVSSDRALREPRLRHVQCILVSRSGELLVEQYFRDRVRDDLSNTHSITKSVLSTLVGIAIGAGRLALSTRVGDLMTVDADKSAIEVQHLLTMTSGLAADGPYDIDAIADSGRPWVAGVLDAPLRAVPGTTFQYNNGAAHLLGALLALAVREPLAQFAEAWLFAPLGVERYRWPRDPQGQALGCGQLELRPIDLLRLGELYLRDGASIVTPEYVRAATTAATEGGPPERVPYGFLWWVTKVDGSPAFFAGGFGGQYLTIVPELELVVVTTADATAWTPASADPLSLVAEVVVPALVG